MKRNRKFIVIVVATVLACLATGCKHNKTPTQKQEAMKEWNQARARVMASLAKSQFESGNSDKAQQTCEEALRLCPDDAKLHTLTGRILIEKGLLEQAEKELALARKLDPKSAEADYFSGLVYQRWQKPDTAYEFYLSASQKDQNELAYLLARAEMLVAIDCAPEALAALKGKMEFFEHAPALYLAIGQLQATMGDYTQAIEALQKACILAPDDIQAREQLAMAQFKAKKFREASDGFSRLLKNPECTKRGDLWLALGECQMQLGRTREARNSFEEASNLDPGSVTAWLSQAKATLQLGDVRYSETILRKAMLLDASSAETHLLMGYVRVRQNRMSEALTEFQKASALDRTDPVSLCMTGYVLEKTGKHDAAMRFYAAALKIKPDDELAAQLMASVETGN